MSELLTFINKTKIIDSRLESIADQLIGDYDSGRIKTELELIYKLKQAIKDFYYSIDKPLFKFRPAYSTPISEDYNQMLAEANLDMITILNECENLSAALGSSFIAVELDRNMMSNKVKYINKKLEDINNRMLSNVETNSIVFTDSFTNTENAEQTDNENAAKINTVDGLLTLNTTNALRCDEEAFVEVLEGSNGFPGTTHTVDILNNEMHYVGESTVHLDLNEIIDNNSDTWFEYELLSVDDEVLNKCNGYGFEYKEGLKWITDESCLKLKLKLTLAQTIEANWISLTPFYVDNKNVKPCVITKCTVSDGASAIQEINQLKIFDDNTVIMFEPQIVNYVILEFEQPMSYTVNVGHNYYTKMNIDNTSVFDEDEIDSYDRVDGPSPSVELLNIKYDPNTKKYVNPKNQNETGETFIDSAYLKQQLFDDKEDTDKIKFNKEIIKAKRYCIGIKNISIAQYNFKEVGEYVSKEFTVKDSIASISLEADDYMSVTLDEALTKKEITAGIKAPWIKYYISFDSGSTWEGIFPKHRSFQGPCKFVLNSEIPKNLRTINVRYIDSLIKYTGVKIKIVLTRPVLEGYSSKTPVVYKYSLKVLTGGDNIEY